MSTLPPESGVRRTPVVVKVAMAAAAIVVSLGLCEIVARVIFPAPPDAEREPQIVYLSDPEIRYVMAPSQRGWIDDGLIGVNALGFRGPEVQVPKPAGRFRIAVIGDSVTLGWGVADNETFSAQLERRLHAQYPDLDLDVVNLGVGGYDTRQEVTLLERHLAQLQPDLVLVGFYSNDVPDAADDNGGNVGGTRVIGATAEPGHVMHMNPTEATGWSARLRKVRMAYVIGRGINHLLGRGEWGMVRFSLELDMLQGTDSPVLDKAWQTVATQFQRLQQLAEQWKFGVAVVALPCKEQVMGQYPNAKYQRRLEAIIQPMRFPLIDPLPSLADHRPDGELYIPYDRNHPSALGHRIIGEVIEQYVATHGLLGHASPSRP